MRHCLTRPRARNRFIQSGAIAAPGKFGRVIARAAARRGNVSASTLTTPPAQFAPHLGAPHLGAPHLGAPHLGAPGLAVATENTGSEGAATGSDAYETTGLPNDWSLVCAMSRGDQTAAASLYDRYGAFVYGMMLHVVRDAAVAEELVLDVFTRAWREAAHCITSRISVRDWIKLIAVTRVFAHLRTHAAERSSMDAKARAVPA